jgi:phosphatidylglycerophosphate synthase
MENIKTLRKICQESRKAADTWHGIHIARPISIYITRLFLLWNISANTVTLLFTLIGIIAAVCFFLGTNKFMIIGALLLQFWYILDHVDGEIARYKKETSLTGVYFDRISHYIVQPLIFFALGMGIYRNDNSLIYIMLGFLSGFSILMISLVDDIKDLTLFHKYTTLDKFFATPAAKNDFGKSQSAVKKLFMLIHSLCTYPNIMNIITVLAALGIFVRENLILLVLWFYAITASIVWIARLTFFITTKKIDLESKR